MKIISFDEFLKKSDFFVQEAKAGKIFVYPTDTIYGIGGIVRQPVIDTITEIKRRPTYKRYPVIIPWFQTVDLFFNVWLHFEKQRLDFKRKYCWPIYQQGGSVKYTRWLSLLCPWNEDIEQHYNFHLLTDTWKISVRWIDHAFQEFVTALEEPFITTSVNYSWQSPIQSIEQIDDKQSAMIDYAIDAWPLTWESSVIIEYMTWEVIRE